MSEDELAPLLSAVVGAVLGILVGYFAWIGAANGGPFFHDWVVTFARGQVIWWAIGGAVMGGTIGYIRQMR